MPNQRKPTEPQPKTPNLYHSAAGSQPKTKTHHGGTETRRKTGENQLHRGGAETNLISMKICDTKESKKIETHLPNVFTFPGTGQPVCPMSWVFHRSWS